MRMRIRSGLSFTMTLVIVSLILVVTAGIVMGFSGSTITQFFSGVGGEQESQVDEFKIQNACNDLKDRIQTQFCDKYMPVDYDGPGLIDSSGNTGGSASCSPAHADAHLCPGAYSAQNIGNYGPSSDYWPVSTSDNCADGTADVEEKRQLPTERLANQSGTAYIKTGNELACSWPSAFDTEVEVEGETFDCLEEQYIVSDTCPVQ